MLRMQQEHAGIVNDKLTTLNLSLWVVDPPTSKLPSPSQTCHTTPHQILNNWKTWGISLGIQILRQSSFPLTNNQSIHTFEYSLHSFLIHSPDLLTKLFEYNFGKVTFISRRLLSKCVTYDIRNISVWQVFYQYLKQKHDNFSCIIKRVCILLSRKCVWNTTFFRPEL